MDGRERVEPSCYSMGEGERNMQKGFNGSDEGGRRKPFFASGLQKGKNRGKKSKSPNDQHVLKDGGRGFSGGGKIRETIPKP